MPLFKDPQLLSALSGDFTLRVACQLLLLICCFVPVWAYAADSDGDGLDDAVETNTGTYVSAVDTGTDPAKADTDDDGFNDGFELGFGTDPLDIHSTPIQQKLTIETSLAYENFGNGIAVSGNTLVIASNNQEAKSYSGAVYVFVYSGDRWVEEAKIAPDDLESSDYFGKELSIDGDTLVVGVRSSSTHVYGSGAVYVFTRSDGQWSQQAKLIASDAGSGDYFGSSVAIQGDTIAVGASSDDDLADNSGAVYMFERINGTWLEQVKLKASDAARSNYFGRDLLLNDDTLVIAASYDADLESSFYIKHGSAYVFSRNTSSFPLRNQLWLEQAKLIPDDGHRDDSFGDSIAINKDTIVIGAPRNAANGSFSGAAYTFVNNNNVWAQEAKLVSSTPAQSEYFGQSLSLSGDDLLIGAHGNKDEGSFSGVAYLFSHIDNSWEPLAKLSASATKASDQFGIHVVISQSKAFLAATGDDDQAYSSGAVYVLDLDVDSDALLDVAETDTGILVDASNTGTAPFDEDTDDDGLKDGFEVKAGFNPHGAGEFNLDSDNDGLSNQQEQQLGTDPLMADSDADGLSDKVETNTGVFIDAQNTGSDPLNPDSDGDGLLDSVETGTTVFVDSNNTGTDPNKQDTDNGGAADGFEVANGFNPLSSADDGLDSDTDGLTNEQEQFFGTNPNIQDTDADGLLDGVETYTGLFNDADNTGTDPLLADTDKDGFADGLEVGVGINPLDKNHTPIQKKIVSTDSPNLADFGYSVAIDGETAVIGAYSEDSSLGAAYVFVRDGEVWSQQAKLLASDGQNYDLFGDAVAIEGSTIVVGARGQDGSGNNTGAAYVFTRSGDSWTEKQKLLPSAESVDSNFGYSIDISGQQIIVGAYTEELGDDDKRGGAYIFGKVADSWVQEAHLSALNAANFTSFAEAVAIEGDIAVVGDYRAIHTYGSVSKGEVYIFKKSANIWSLQKILRSGQSENSIVFGRSVDIDQGTIFIGDPGYNSQGSVHIFSPLSGGDYIETILQSSQSSYDNFGDSISADGGLLIVGAENDNVAGSSAGAVSIYVKNSRGDWIEQSRFSGFDIADYNYFGASVTLSGNTVIVGAHQKTSRDHYDGAAYIYRILDSDADGLIDLAETDTGVQLDNKNIGTSPQNEDTDGDGLLDGYEVFYGLNPLVFNPPTEDVDGDGLTVLQEQLMQTDPLDKDSDNDGLDDNVETHTGSYIDANSTGTNPNSADTDGDGLLDSVETNTGLLVDAQDTGTDPFLADTDNDGLLDGTEISYGLDPFVTGDEADDLDQDGLSNLQEQMIGTALDDSDSDNDGLIDSVENNTGIYTDYSATGTDPLNADTDQDNFQDGLEVGEGTDPHNDQDTPVKLLLPDNLKDGDNYGISVSISDGFMAVSSTGYDAVTSNTGLVSIYQNSESGWELHAELTSPNLEHYGRFGISLSLDNDTLAVGTEEETVYVFQRQGDLWELQATLQPEDGAYDDRFGQSLALDDDSLIIGASDHDVLGVNRTGAAYIYIRNAGEWQLQQKVVAASRSSNYQFGTDVAIDGDTVIVGSPGETVNNFGDGAAYILSRSNGFWFHAQKLIAGAGTFSRDFGSSVAVEQDTIVIGAPDSSSNSEAYIFHYSNGSWQKQATLTGRDYYGSSQFGKKVAIAGNKIVVSAPSENYFSSDAGSSYLFVIENGTWTEYARFVAGDGTTEYGRFGSGLAIDQNTLAIGARQAHLEELAYTGALYVHSLDFDSDGLLNNYETSSNIFIDQYDTGTNPIIADTDNDRHLDGDEVLGGSNPLIMLDADGDGMPDDYEADVGLDFNDPADASIDADNDGLTNLEEFLLKTDHENADTDADDIRDDYEANFGLDPLDASDRNLDTDGDGLTAFSEYLLGTAANNSDTDMDGLLDGFEADNGFNPLVGGEEILDGDNDGLTNLQEQSRATDPGDPDTDADGLLDGVETNTGIFVDADDTGTDPLDADTDDDGLLDGVETNTAIYLTVDNTGSDPLRADTDEDGLDDGYEEANGFNLLDPVEGSLDLDEDGLTNLQELALGTDRLIADTDSDGLLDGVETDTGLFIDSTDTGTDPLSYDTDQDDFSDGVEVELGVNALDVDRTPLQQRLGSVDGLDSDVGMYVEISGDTAVVGASYAHEVATRSGLVYVFTLVDGEWVEQAKLTGTDTESYDYFGGSVAIDQDTIVVGATGDDDKGSTSGSVYIFSRSEGVWTEQAKLTASNGTSSDGFGRTVAISGDTIMVGTSSERSAYVFTYREGSWVQDSQIRVGNDAFGSSMAIDGDIAVVGDPTYNDSGIYSSGAAYLFARVGDSWVQQARLTATDASYNARFGADVDIDGDTVIVGASFDEHEGYGTGAAYIFTLVDGEWVEQTRLVAGDAASYQYFGASVSLSDDIAVISGYQTNWSSVFSGSTYIFTATDGNWSENSKVRVSYTDGFSSIGGSAGFEGRHIVLGNSETVYFINLDADNDGLLNVAETNTGVFVDAADAGTDPFDFDSDNDGLLDGFEALNGLNPLLADDASTDSDMDGLTLLQELNAGTDPQDPDSDNDNLLDGVESNTGIYIDAMDTGTDPLNADSDDDGLRDDRETNTGVYIDAEDSGSSPVDNDTDDDGLLDGFEVLHGFDLLATDESGVDSDNDGLNNLQEQSKATDPLVADTDGDGLADGVESGSGVFIDAADTGTDPLDADTDKDGFNDGLEVSIGVDPLEAGNTPIQKKVAPSDGQAGDRFGFQVSISGDIAVVGAPFHGGDASGAAYVFRRVGDAWVEQEKLTASNARPSDLFGARVVIDGNTIAVSAFNAGTTGSGEVYLFIRQQEEWIEQARLQTDDLSSNDAFGYTLAISENTLMLGTWLEEQVYVYERFNNVWQRQTIIAQGNNSFGNSISIDGDTAVIGDSYEYYGSSSRAGAVYLYTRSNGVWSQHARLTASDASGGAYFGHSVSLDNDYLIVGAYRDDAIDVSAGAAYIFARSGEDWVEQVKLTASDTGRFDSFGASVSISGNIALVGATGNVGDWGEGSAYLFIKEGANWVEKDFFTDSVAASYDDFGISLAIDGKHLVVGAPGESDGTGWAYFTDIDVDDDGLLNAIETNTGTYIDAGNTGTDPLSDDTDNDGLLDNYEVRFGFNPVVSGDGILDVDNDGLTNLQEQMKGTDPTNADTDGDNLLDGIETDTGVFIDENNVGTSPLNADTDGDNLLDDVETNTGLFIDSANTGTNPLMADSDSDGLRDDYEIEHGFNPLLAGDGDLDSDNDGLSNLKEFLLATNPRNNDTDGDGLLDGVEVDYSFNPLLSGEAFMDLDGDGLKNIDEQLLGTSLSNRDTDNDGVNDGEEYRAGTDPNDDADCPEWGCSPQSWWKFKSMIKD